MPFNYYSIDANILISFKVFEISFSDNPFIFICLIAYSFPSFFLMALNTVLNDPDPKSRDTDFV